MADKKQVRSPTFQIFAADAIGMQMTDNIVQLYFGMEQKTPGEASVIFEQIGIAMTPRSLKVLQVVLNRALESFEKDNGPIPINADKLAGIVPIIQKDEG